MAADTPAKKTKQMTHKGSVMVVGKTVKEGSEAWQIVRDGQQMTIRTSDTSARAMDEAVVIYDRVLKSLASR